MQERLQELLQDPVVVQMLQPPHTRTRMGTWLLGLEAIMRMLLPQECAWRAAVNTVCRSLHAACFTPWHGEQVIPSPHKRLCLQVALSIAAHVRGGTLGVEEMCDCLDLHNVNKGEAPNILRSELMLAILDRVFLRFIQGAAPVGFCCDDRRPASASELGLPPCRGVAECGQKQDSGLQRRSW